jgi:Fe-S cluster biosynthesis and repair protein YggX
MANDDPENELAHFSLGKALLDAGQVAEAIAPFERTVQLNNQFSKAYQLWGTCLAKTGQKEAALAALLRGHQVATERGDNVPRDEMAKLITELGGTVPTAADSDRPAGVGGFRCQRPGCRAGSYAEQLDAPPMNDDLGRLIHERICAECWREWLGMGIKVINEMRLDFSDDRPIYQGLTASQVYDNYMKEFLGIDG